MTGRKRLSNAQGVSWWHAAGDDEGQMVVELAVLIPPMIVIALVLLNVMWFVEAVTLFDRVVPDTVLALAVSPAGGSEDALQERVVDAALEETLADVRGVEVSVRVETAWEVSDGLGFSFAPHLTRYVCTLTYYPWPTQLSIAGFDAGIPLALRHERTFTIDRYRSGVVF